MICRHPKATVARPNSECSEPLKPLLTVTATIAPASASPTENISPYLCVLNHHHSMCLTATWRCRPVSVGFGLPKRMMMMQIGTSTNQTATIRMA